MTYPSARHVRSHSPPSQTAQRGYEVYRDCLRLEFEFRCVYCLTPEAQIVEDHGGFEIEHFRPKARASFQHLRNDYANLFWSCRTCNKAKHDRWPTPAEEARGEHFLNPCDHVMSDHLEIERATVRSRTQAGWYTRKHLRLDKQRQTERRQQRLDAMHLMELCDQALKHPRAGTPPHEIAAARREIERLRRILQLSPPSDAPSGCAC